MSQNNPNKQTTRIPKTFWPDLVGRVWKYLITGNHETLDQTVLFRDEYFVWAVVQLKDKVRIDLSERMTPTEMAQTWQELKCIILFWASNPLDTGSLKLNLEHFYHKHKHYVTEEWVTILREKLLPDQTFYDLFFKQIATWWNALDDGLAVAMASICANMWQDKVNCREGLEEALQLAKNYGPIDDMSEEVGHYRETSVRIETIFNCFKDESDDDEKCDLKKELLEQLQKATEKEYSPIMKTMDQLRLNLSNEHKFLFDKRRVMRTMETITLLTTGIGLVLLLIAQRNAEARKCINPLLGKLVSFNSIMFYLSIHQDKANLILRLYECNGFVDKFESIECELKTIRDNLKVIEKLLEKEFD